MGFAIGVAIHDEERNIGRLLGYLRAEPLEKLGLDRVVVVSSGSRDRSDEIVREVAASWPRLRLIVEKERRGKASAINLFLEAARGSEILVLMSGDVLPEPGAIGLLLDAFADPRVGMAAGRPTPFGQPSRLIHHVARLQWDLHHEVSLKAPKLGEVVAFRNVVDRIPADTAVDEASLEAILAARGHRLAYVPAAVIWNKGPDTVSDFLKQRRRIAAGHRHLSATRGYRVTTSRPRLVVAALWRLLGREPRRSGVALVAVALEVYGRVLGFYDLTVRGKNPYVWDVAGSTKDLAQAPPAGRRAG